MSTIYTPCKTENKSFFYNILNLINPRKDFPKSLSLISCLDIKKSDN